MLDLSQVLALAIFLLLFIAIVIGKVHRYIPALAGAALTIGVVFLLVMRSPEAVVNVLNLGQLAQASFWVSRKEHLDVAGVNWQTMIFIAGMMIMVEGMGEVGFFNWLCLSAAKLVKYRVLPIFVSFMLISGFLSMFIGSITVLLFMTAIVIELARLLEIDPVPFIIAMIFASNVGGGATMSGDPPNIIIGTSLGFTFTDFAINTGVVAWIGMLASLGFFCLVFRKSLVSKAHVGTLAQYPQPSEAITNTPLFLVSVCIFVLVVVLLLTHATTGLSLAFIGVIAASITLAAAPVRSRHIVGRVDWRTLLFFLGLFIAVGGLEETGVLQRLATIIGEISSGSTVIVLTIILWLSAFASGVVDNIPFAAAMVPVVSGLSQTAAIGLPPLAWALALGTDIGGNATPIGASANVVGTAIAETEGYRISWRRYMKSALPATLLVVGICWAYLMLRYL